jgi:hypothetical protein
MARLLWTIIENRKRAWMARLDRLGKLLAG